MDIRYGLISADSHVVMDKDAFVKRMSKSKWGDRVPQLMEVESKGRLVHRWVVNAKSLGGRGVCNCPAVMGDPLRNSYPQRWEDVPAKAYVPYNDSMAEWYRASDRFIPLAMVPILGGMDAAVAEVERAATMGHRGIVMLALPSLLVKELAHISDPYWYPLWEACQDAELPIHLHASAGLARKITFPEWEGYSPYQQHAAFTVPTAAWPAQIIPNIIFSGIAYRFPRLKWVFAETGIGSVSCAQTACDHEWESRQLWRHGLEQRPSELIRQQVYVNFWYEQAGIELRQQVGIDNIMWESDYPHIASTYPDSWKFVERSLQGVPKDERKKMLYLNAQSLYRLM